MAKPHGKNLLEKGQEGKSKKHWYSFILSRRRMKRIRLSGGPKCAPGIKFEIYQGCSQPELHKGA